MMTNSTEQQIDNETYRNTCAQLGIGHPTVGRNMGTSINVVQFHLLVDGLIILSGQKSTPKSNMSLLLPLSMCRFAVLLSILSKFNMSFQCMQMLRSPHIGHSPELQWILTWSCRKLGWSDWKTISVCHIMITVKELLHKKNSFFMKLCAPCNDGPLDLRKSFRCPGRRIVPKDPSHMKHSFKSNQV